jgi:hypothetical protein
MSRHLIVRPFWYSRIPSRCSYNKINQTQSCQNSKLINGVLKEELDFQGFVLSDWAALINGVQPVGFCRLSNPSFL